MWECIQCKNKIDDSVNFCVACNLPRPQYPPNYCTNPMCEEYEVMLEDPNQTNCGKCGSLTTIGKEVAKYT